MDNIESPQAQISELALELMKSSEDADKLNDDQYFQEVFVASKVLFNLSDDQISNLFSISKPSIQRWITGKSSPHPNMRRHIFTVLATQGYNFALSLENLQRKGYKS